MPKALSRMPLRRMTLRLRPLMLTMLQPRLLM